MWTNGSFANYQSMLVILSLNLYVPQFKFCQILCKCICADNKLCQKYRQLQQELCSEAIFSPSPISKAHNALAIEGLKLQINLNANPPDKDGGELYKNCYHGGNISASSVERKQSCDDSDKRKVIKWNGEINLIIRSANAMMTHILLSCYNIGHIRARHKVFSLGLFCILGGNMKYKK